MSILWHFLTFCIPLFFVTFFITPFLHPAFTMPMILPTGVLCSLQAGDVEEEQLVKSCSQLREVQRLTSEFRPWDT